MKTYTVTQQFSSIHAVRSGNKLTTPVVLGDYTTTNLPAAISQAAKQYNIAALLLSGKPAAN
jgi:hypothetical protein